MIFSKANFETFFTSLAIQACGVATGILTARLLGPTRRGELAVVILWPTILSNLALLGCNWVIAREVARSPERESDWIVAGIAIGLVSAFVVCLIGYLLVPVLLSADKSYLAPLARLCLWLIPLDVCNQMLLAIEHGRLRWQRFNLLRLSFFLIYLACIVLLAETRLAQVRWFVFAFLGAQGLTLLLRLWVQRRALVSWRVPHGECMRLVRAGVLYFSATLSNLVSLQFDVILVVSLFDTRAAGIYAVASALADGQSALGEALGLTAFGVLSNQENETGRKNIIAGTFRQSALISSAIGVALATLTPFLVAPLFGAQFLLAVQPAIVLALAASIAASANILNQSLRGAGHPHAGLVSQLVGTGILALLAVFVLRRLGLLGVAFAVFLSAAAQLIVLVLAAAHWLQISPRQFWPFGRREFRSIFQQAANLRVRYQRSPA